jgi:hypothetical protein
MAAKTARVTILGTPEFKEFLVQEAEKEGVSVSKLIRQRCLQRPANDEEEIIQYFLAELKSSTARALVSLEEAIAEATQVLEEIKAGNEEAEPV